MTIYVDEIRDYGKDGKWCHMWTDGDIDELNLFADQLGLKRSYLHRSKGISGDFPHYDLKPSIREKALRNMAEYMPLKKWVKYRMGLNNGKL